MAKKKVIPEYSKVKKNGTEYYRTRILDADGKQVDIYGKTCEEVYDRAQAASRAIADAIFRKNNPTVREYCEKWLKMKSATVRPNTLEGYRKVMEKHIIEPIGDRYIDEITADDLKNLLIDALELGHGRAAALSVMNIGVSLMEVFSLFASSLLAAAGIGWCFGLCGALLMLCAVCLRYTRQKISR